MEKVLMGAPDAPSALVTTSVALVRLMALTPVASPATVFASTVPPLTFRVPVVVAAPLPPVVLARFKLLTHRQRAAGVDVQCAGRRFALAVRADSPHTPCPR